MRKCATTIAGKEEGICLTHAAEHLRMPFHKLHYQVVLRKPRRPRFELYDGVKEDCDLKNKLGYIPWGQIITEDH